MPILGMTRTRRLRRMSSVVAELFEPSRGIAMKTWNKPVIREICVGAEINCYASGEL
ncbi:pyrroloquinoline quinone precursor peptide PqqA [Xanthomonas translucens]|nr:pyrroloquinoline quinone precursor peptide PqqA [Xanthomonas translucens]MCC8446274.1 pyrroloquinoline quinone precursor peptide PqqA [Xanthomonas translucens pv. translucens]MCS3360989.1 pyrroloquinoline quinone precursor peptide PqqA [Xanthomonas translucens pv. translucens]MCS3374964.1 pyrroloquinoline quinone precursor peptide PqqA [Xanthomonas translucens pv. translucens]MCT8279817.1 pyrroloquinoline quinone precursor peptide PqqA [Xanthomonas translucens pv. translucens]MCT8287438.1 p